MPPPDSPLLGSRFRKSATLEATGPFEIHADFWPLITQSPFFFFALTCWVSCASRKNVDCGLRLSEPWSGSVIPQQLITLASLHSTKGMMYFSVMRSSASMVA